MTRLYLLLKFFIIISSSLLADLKDINQSVVKILSFDNGGNKYKATGFNICKRGLIITNAHVLKYSKRILVIDHKLNQLPFVNIIATEKKPDLAIIKIINKTNIPAINFLTSAILKEGDPAYFVDKSKKIYGRLIDVERRNRFYISNHVNYGHSGSPLFNERNQLVGVIFAKRVLHFKRYGKIDMGGYAIPSKELVNFINKNVLSNNNFYLNSIKTIDVVTVSSVNRT